MIATLLLTIATAVPSAPEAAVFLHLVPASNQRSLSTSTLLSTLARPLDRHALVDLVPPERAGVSRERLERCPIEALYGCWFRELRPIAKSGPRFLIAIVENERADDAVELNLVLLDLDRAEAEQAVTPDGSSDEDFEEVLFRIAVRSNPIVVSRDTDSIEAALLRMVDDYVAPVLATAGLWFVAGRPAAREPTVVVAPTPPPPSPALYDASLYGGAGIAVVGTVLLGIAIASGDDRLGCLAAPTASASDCGGGPVPFSSGPRNDASIGQQPSASVLSPGAIGVGLVTLGVGTALTTLFAYERRDTPWWAWVIGGASGLAAFAFTAGVSAR